MSEYLTQNSYPKHCGLIRYDLFCSINNSIMQEGKFTKSPIPVDYQIVYSILIGIIIWMMSMGSALAEEGTKGKITGQVVDKKTSEPLIGVSVFIENTKTGSMTDIEGRFAINNLDEGKYNLMVNYVGYKSKIVQEVNVRVKEPSSVNVVLEESATEMDAVTIVASVDKNTVGNILLMQQKNVSITSGISQDEIKKSADKSVNEVVKRMSSTSIQDNKFMIIRGLSDRYNSGLINDMPLPSTEPDRKAFSFDIFPSNMLDNIVVFKTASPELPGEDRKSNV